MKFGPIPTRDALGAILAHSADLASGRLRKGKVLTADDITNLTAQGVQTVTVAQLDPDDMHEDAAAQKLADAFMPHGSGLRVTKAATGRVNIIATAPGIFKCDVSSVEKVNAINPMITIATQPQYQRVVTGDMVATVKIISYGVAASDITRAVQIAKPLALLTAQHTEVTLIETKIGPDTPSPKGRAAMATRLDRLGCQLTRRVVVNHDEGALAQAISAASGSMVLILTGSATSDAYDVAPQAVRAAGGKITRFGMPVDPGNLLFVGAIGDKPVIGLPGCARSLALNGADWVVERTLCGLNVSDTDIAGMGVGGLLKESPARHRPRRHPKE
ncbi:molybdenum cofactor cytidylyltransferase [Loktanella ponticola]|uniref:Molybdenum cofactor cytidylyltransferase n=1 Tax=Yoonia ponticola TaxID=1524255 RepID=A0A7W9EZ46_9RHOB|nr:molybdopterin-binding protein [Yoonia ponticola]MBB5721780.1 molybdenum cofactor cytidylyltransferase [Yoonia ponticola]